MQKRAMLCGNRLNRLLQSSARTEKQQVCESTEIIDGHQRAFKERCGHQCLL